MMTVISHEAKPTDHKVGKPKDISYLMQKLDTVKKNPVFAFYVFPYKETIKYII